MQPEDCQCLYVSDWWQYRVSGKCSSIWEKDVYVCMRFKRQIHTHIRDIVRHIHRGSCTACKVVLAGSHRGSPSSCNSLGCYRSTVKTTHTHTLHQIHSNNSDLVVSSCAFTHYGGSDVTIYKSLSLRFNGHFPGEPGLVGVYWSKGWWRWW